MTALASAGPWQRSVTHKSSGGRSLRDAKGVEGKKPHTIRLGGFGKRLQLLQRGVGVVPAAIAICTIVECNREL